MATDSREVSGEYTITEPYTYSVIPGTDEWKNLTPAERYEECYVSEDIAKKMTTEALVGTVLGYPFWINVYAFDTLEKGIDMVSSYFPPLAELLKRSDAAEVLEGYLANRPYPNSDEVDLIAYGADSLFIAIGEGSAAT